MTAEDYREKILKVIIEYEKQLDPVEQCDIAFAIGELYEVIRAVETS